MNKAVSRQSAGLFECVKQQTRFSAMGSPRINVSVVAPMRLNCRWLALRNAPTCSCIVIHFLISLCSSYNKAPDSSSDRQDRPSDRPIGFKPFSFLQVRFLLSSVSKP
jgi:hypothetical protein